MTLINTKEFLANEEKYFSMALNSEVCIQRGDFLYHLVSTPIEEIEEIEEHYPPQPYLEPDDDFRRAITGEELKRRMRTSISNFFANKQ